MILLKRIRYIAYIIFILLGALTPYFSSGQPTGTNVYVIPIHGEINPAITGHVSKAISEINRDQNAALIILDIDTYGGRIDAAEEISKEILGISIPTVSFVNTKAESAGVLLTISGDTIVMAPAGTIGSAETIPNTEKVLSMWTSLLRGVAEEKDRDPNLIASMADRSISIPGVIEEGRLLNLTTQEAINLGLAEFSAKDYFSIVEELEIGNANIIVKDVNFTVRLAQALSSSYVASMLITIGFIGFIIEIFTAGFGLGGTISLIAFALYFAGGILAGNTGAGVLIIFLAGILLLLIEAVVPGFGVPGIGGIISIIISIVMAANDARSATIYIFVALVLSIIFLILLLKYGSRSKFFDKIILMENLTKEKGYQANKEYGHLIGKEGVVLTLLRPSGTIEVGDEILDVVSDVGFVEKGSTVKIVKVEGRKIIVKKIN
nr:NfeD family protein [Serpentinicella alkaliphila]